ncbi:MAG: hypothetical protein ACXWUG_04635 [Polyangiales bacterium]
MRWFVVFTIALLASCSSAEPESAPADASAEIDSASDDVAVEAAVEAALDSGTIDVSEAGPDSATCAWSGAPGECISTSACAALGHHSSYPGLCPGAADIQCCIVTPDPADNPPTPSGYTLMKQADVTSDMTTWAVDILHDPVTYPMFSTTTKVFGTKTVLARVEWHAPDFLNMSIHRGVTLYQPL